MLCTPSPNGKSSNHSPRRNSHSDSFTRLFGSSDSKRTTPRRASLTKHDVTNRNPVTGDGVNSWDQKIINRASPKGQTGKNNLKYEKFNFGYFFIACDCNMVKLRKNLKY